MKKLVITVLMLCAVAPGVLAQDNITAITYQPSVPTGDLEQFIGKTSWIGWGIEGRHFRDSSSPITFGFSFAWHVFDDQLYSTQTVDKGAVTGTQNRWVNSLPMLITLDYYFGRKERIKPFVGVGAGAYYIYQKLNIGVWSFEETNWRFGIMGEVGLQFPLGDMEGFTSARYHYAYPSGDSISGEKIDIQYGTWLIGLAWTRW
jgi:opacity protein-like surface antigen